MNPRAMLPVLAMLAVASTSCSRVRHIKPYKHKVRQYAHDSYASPDAARTPGSLWSEGAHNLFEETRARRVGDILTVTLQERADATRDTATSTQRQSNAQVGVSAVLNAMYSYALTHPGFDPNAILAGMSQSAFNSQGGTSRSGQLDAILPVRIKEQLPNGDLYVEGSKMLLLNNEESTLYLSGVVRLIDIDTDNTVDSSRLADVELEYTGRGVLADNENPGWFSRILGWVWPF